jgi:hypothetical protein
MPLKKPANRSKKAIQSAVSANIRELKKSKTQRPMKQIVAIALSSAKVKKK